ncbi:MAG: hypothetical protein ACYCZF_12600 [Anaerolineae bacterium]
MHAFEKRWVVGLLLVMGLVMLLAGSAGAQTEVGVIRGDPLTIRINPDGSLQVNHKLYTQGASFGYAGSGFFIAANKITHGPFFTHMEFVEQQATTGQGTRSDPFRSVLHMRINRDGIALDVIQTVLYVSGAPSFQLEWRLANTGTANICIKAYHAADLYFADDDYGYGYYNAGTGSVGGFNKAKDWFMVFTPINPATHYEEAGYGTIWSRVQNQEDLRDTISSEYIDNGAALQWDLCLAGGQVKTVADVWSFGVSEGAIIAAAEQATESGDDFGGSAPGPLGIGAPRFREVAPGSPQLTTSIPTPLDVSFTPEVMGSNLLWAALATIIFIIANEILNRTLADYEGFFRKLFKPFDFIGRWRKKAGVSQGSKRYAWFEWVKLVIITIIYGLTFSFLDPSWKPLTFNGIWLFMTMAIAFGVVGLIDDIVQWRTATRWKLPTRITISPGNLLLALFSTLFSRTLVLTPGVMFGTPEAFEIDENVLTEKRKKRLLLMAAGVLVAILLGSWLPTTLSSLALSASTALPEKLRPFILVPVASLQSLLLLVFAVTVQNLFLHMLALPNTIGEMIKRWNPVVWFFSLLLVSFVLLQTLLNPNGELAHMIQTSNMRVFMGTILLFLLFTIAMRVLLKRFQPKDAGVSTPPPGAGGDVTVVGSTADGPPSTPPAQISAAIAPPAGQVSAPTLAGSTPPPAATVTWQTEALGDKTAAPSTPASTAPDPPAPTDTTLTGG